MINRAYLDCDFFEEYKPNECVDVIIPAIIYIPNRILIALCKIENSDCDVEFPYLTMMKCGKYS